MKMDCKMLLFNAKNATANHINLLNFTNLL